MGNDQMYDFLGYSTRDFSETDVHKFNKPKILHFYQVSKYLVRLKFPIFSPFLPIFYLFANFSVLYSLLLSLSKRITYTRERLLVSFIYKNQCCEFLLHSVKREMKSLPRITLTDKIYFYSPDVPHQ